MSRVEIGLLNTWVSNNKLTLIEQCRSFLLCTHLQEKERGEGREERERKKIQLESKITWHGNGMSLLRTHGWQWGLSHWMQLNLSSRKEHFAKYVAASLLLSEKEEGGRIH